MDLQAFDKKKASEAKARKAAKEAEAARTAEMDLLYKGAPKKDDTEKTAKQVAVQMPRPRTFWSLVQGDQARHACGLGGRQLCTYVQCKVSNLK